MLKPPFLESPKVDAILCCNGLSGHLPCWHWNHCDARGVLQSRLPRPSLTWAPSATDDGGMPFPFCEALSQRLRNLPFNSHLLFKCGLERLQKLPHHPFNLGILCVAKLEVVPHVKAACQNDHRTRSRLKDIFRFSQKLWDGLVLADGNAGPTTRVPWHPNHRPAELPWVHPESHGKEYDKPPPGLICLQREFGNMWWRCIRKVLGAWNAAAQATILRLKTWGNSSIISAPWTKLRGTIQHWIWHDMT